MNSAQSVGEGHGVKIRPPEGQFILFLIYGKVQKNFFVGSTNTPSMQQFQFDASCKQWTSIGGVKANVEV